MAHHAWGRHCSLMLGALLMAQNADQSPDLFTDDQSRELLTDTMRALFPPRVEYAREQHEMLQKLSEITGRSVRELVGDAIDLYLSQQSPALIEWRCPDS